MAAMATTTVLETFPKETVSPEQVEAERKERLSRPNVVSSETSDDGTLLLLRTVIKLD
jgi:hypothetical protein